MKDDIKGADGTRGRSLSKVDLHVTISEPSSSDRRSRWLNDKIRFSNNKKSSSNSNNCYDDSSQKEKDSGYHGDSLPRSRTSPHPLITLSSDDDVRKRNGIHPAFEYGSQKWRRQDTMDPEKPPLRSTCSLNSSCHHSFYDEDCHQHSTTDQDDNDDPDPHHYSLSRRNGIRHSARRRHETMDIESPTESVYSISSESEGSQGELEPSTPDTITEESPGLLKSRHEKIRKQSVFFTSSKPWTEESLTSSFRDLSPSTGSILEAAWNGDVNVLEELLRTEENLPHVNAYDVYGRTPLHLAAASGNVEAAKLLLSKGADVEVCDFQQKASPLMCAAGCGSETVLELLLAHGANVNAGYELGKTALHWAVQAESVPCVKRLLECGALQNPPLAYSETALHVAAVLGHLECMKLLIDHGADVSLIKGDTRSTALHLAAEEGSIECMRHLLKCGASHSAQDARGQTPLHISAASDTDATALLLSAGADPHARDSNGRTPLHCAVGRGSRAAECVRLLIEAQADVNTQDCYGYTPLHLAAVNESSQCASILLNNGGDATAKTKAGTSALSLLFRKIPDVVRHLVDRLNSAVHMHDHDPGDPDCEVRLDFRALITNHSGKRMQPDNKNGKAPSLPQMYYQTPRKETEFLTNLIAAGNKKILSHPLSEAFLYLKWKCVRKFFWASLCFQTALVLLYTSYVLNVYLSQCPFPGEGSLTESGEVPSTVGPPPIPRASPEFPTTRSPRFGKWDDVMEKLRNKTRKRRSRFSWWSLNPRRKSTTTPPPSTTTLARAPERMSKFRSILLNPEPLDKKNESGDFMTMQEIGDDEDGDEEGEEVKDNCQLGITLTVIWMLLITFTLILAIKEIFQIVQAPLAYVSSSENWGQWALIVSVLVTAWHPTYPGFHLSHWQYQAAAFGIFLAYSLMLLQVGRQPALGLYVQMLGKVAANFGLFILAYVCLLIAFALAFCVIYPGNPAFSSPPLAFIKVLTMMVGEVDYEDQFYDESKEFPYPIAAHILHTAFVVFISIILMNLLVGLAVHDIQGLQKGAKLNRLSRQTALISRLESFILSKRLQSWLPKSVGMTLQKEALLVPTSYQWSFYIRPNDPRDKRLPKEIKQAVLRLAASNFTAKHGGIKAHPDAKSSHLLHHTNSDTTFRRIDHRIDKLQQKLDTALKTLNDNSEKILLFLQKQEKENSISSSS